MSTTTDPTCPICGKSESLHQIVCPDSSPWRTGSEKPGVRGWYLVKWDGYLRAEEGRFLGKWHQMHSDGSLEERDAPVWWMPIPPLPEEVKP